MDWGTPIGGGCCWGGIPPFTPGAALPIIQCPPPDPLPDTASGKGAVTEERETGLVRMITLAFEGTKENHN